MKKFILLFAITITTLFTQAKMVSIDDSLLTETQKTILNTDQNIQNVGKWVGLGKEVGEAFNQCFSAFTDQTNRFANTKVGTWAMVIITYKVVGQDFIRFVFGILVFFIVLALTIWQFVAGFFPTKIAKNGGLWQWISGKVEYEITYPDDDNKGTALSLLCICTIVNIIVTSMIMFA